jgi:hypothetical protein
MSAGSPQVDDRGTVDLRTIPREVTDEDSRIYARLVSTDLDETQRQRVLAPPRVCAKDRCVMSVHWHPEFVPLELVRGRLRSMFPNREEELLIPTQHNELISFGPYTGVEIDCHSPSFHRKIQLLAHFANERLEGRGDVFKAMVAHTAKYRADQLFEYIDSILEPKLEDRVRLAAAETGADAFLVDFARIHVRRLKETFERHEHVTPLCMVRNKLIRNYFDALRDTYPTRLIHHVQAFLRAVKVIVKERFALEYFYQTQQFIEEIRGLGGCIVIPHPEQFWPVLLDELDVDAIEVWNPQSFQYTEFLIQVVDQKNRSSRRKGRPILITMGDDTHMAEKTRDPAHQDKAKASREIGVQPMWDDPGTRKCLITANAGREQFVHQYKARLDG